MSRRQFTWLLGAALIAVLAVMLMAPREAGEDGAPDARLLPGFSDRVNDVDQVALVAAGAREVVTLRREPDGWVVDQLGGYPADWPKLHALLRDLAEAEVVEPKTANPEYHARLGVEDVATEEAGGVLVRIGGDESLGLVVGHAPSGRDGRYVRLQDNEQAVLVDREFELPPSPVEWAQREIVDLPSTEVREVEILHPDGDRVLVGKTSAEAADFALLNVPDGREARGGWANNQLGGAFTRLRADDIRVDDLDGADAGGEVQGPVRIRVQTFDGLELIAELYALGAEGEREDWLRLSAARPGEAAAASTANDGSADEAAGGAGAKELESLQARTRGWLFRVPAFKADTLRKRREDLLEPLAEE